MAAKGVFKFSVERWGKLSQERLAKLQRGVIIKLFSAVIMDTPVDTGRLRANWRISIGTPNLKPLPESYDKSGAVTISGVAKFVSANKPSATFWLSNNLPYAWRIEYEGWSHTKAPEGMVRKNVRRIVRLLEEENRKVQKS